MGIDSWEGGGAGPLGGGEEREWGGDKLLKVPSRSIGPSWPLHTGPPLQLPLLPRAYLQLSVQLYHITYKSCTPPPQNTLSCSFKLLGCSLILFLSGDSFLLLLVYLADAYQSAEFNSVSFFFNFLKFIFDCVGSSLLRVGFL